ncbi:TetR/AcrR family transcriptional regulator [Pseudonocardia alni]|uniref:TetR/AcrR family transcriptional regulator n=1 Tax=Pseudonocardia alni TaxID=33907 RepID=UPI00280ABC90|nr:TetR/AcrR family transcriptional regulator [Pseudonocardia alni]
MSSTRRDAILDAALDSFLQHGLAGASIEDVCARSGASVGSIYHHAGGKAGLAGAVHASALGDYRSSLRAVFAEHTGRDRRDARAGIQAVVKRHLVWCLDERPRQARFLLLFADTARHHAPAGLADETKDFFSTVMQWWRAHVRHRNVRDLPFDLLYPLWLGPAQEYCRMALTGQTATRHDDDMADSAWRVLRPDRAGADHP